MPTVILEAEDIKFDAVTADHGIALDHRVPKFSHIGVDKTSSSGALVIFDSSEIPSGAQVTSAYFSYEADGNGSGGGNELFLFASLLRDGVWDEKSPSAEQWRGSKTLTLALTLKRVGGQFIAQNTGAASYVPFCHYETIPGADVPPINELGMYFTPFNSITDLISAELFLQSNGAVFTVSIHIWTAKPSVIGGTYDFEPDQFVVATTAITASFAGNTVFSFAGAAPLVTGADYVALIKCLDVPDGVDALNVAMKNGMVEQQAGDPSMAMCKGQDEGLTFTNGMGYDDQPKAGGGFVFWRPIAAGLHTSAGVVYNSQTHGPDAPVDFSDLVQLELDARQASGNVKRIGMLWSAGWDGFSITLPNMTDEDGARQNPRLHVTFDDVAVCIDADTRVKPVVSANLRARPVVSAALNVIPVVNARTEVC